MRTAWLLLFLPISALAQSQSELLAPNGVVPIAQDRAAELFHQCSRSAPVPGDHLWQPSAAEIAGLEAALPAYVADRRSRGEKSPPESVLYHRQYAGFTRGRDRLIYGSFFPAHAAAAPRPLSSPVIICDGGPVFWGIVYNVTTRRFEEPQFNGP